MNPRIVLSESHDHFTSHRKQKKEEVISGFTSTYLGIIGCVVFLLIYYVWTLNSNATQGYTIRQLEKTQNDLRVQLERLEVQIAEIESLDTISSDPETQNMEEI